MRFLILVFLIGFGVIVRAQEVNFNGVTYKVKKEQIFKGSVDITETLSAEEKQQIRIAFDNKMIQDKESIKVEKRLKKAEKDQKSAKKKQKKAEKALKKKEKAEYDFGKSGKNHEEAIKKYDKLKKKGKLSPEDEEKWLKKIENLKKSHEKAKDKLKRA